MHTHINTHTKKSSHLCPKCVLSLRTILRSSFNLTFRTTLTGRYNVGACLGGDLKQGSVFRRISEIAKIDCQHRRVCPCSCPSVRPSDRMGKTRPHWFDFHEILTMYIFRTIFEKFQVSLKSYDTKRHFTGVLISP